MNRIGSLFAVLLMLSSQSALADHHEASGFARYSSTIGMSPFGGSLNFGYNSSAKTSWIFTFGGSPEMEGPFKPEIDGTEYTPTGSSSWMGFFLNHRPFEGTQWFRLIAGLGIGHIEMELDDGQGNRYKAEYRESPVAYVGFGFGLEPKEGFIWGLDFGLLQTAGPIIVPLEGQGDQLEAIGDNWMFGTLLPNVQLSLGWGF